LNAQDRPHYPALDGLRIFCFGFIILWHGLLPFTSWPRGIKSAVSDPTVEMLAWLTRGLAIKELLLIAGLLARASLKRHGPEIYLKKRLPRLLGPCLLAMVFYNGLLHWRWAVSLNLNLSQVIAYYLRSGQAYEIFSPRHLWFILDLAVLTALAVPLQLQLRKRLSPDRQATWQRGFAGLVRSPACLPGLAAATAAMLMLHQPDYPPIQLGNLIPATPTYPILSALGYHALFFGFGWCLQAQPKLLEVCRRRWVVYGLAGLAFRGLYAWLALEAGHPPGMLWLVHFVEALSWWSLVLGLLGAAWQFVTTDRPIWRYAADAGYWCYLSHLFWLGEFQILVNQYWLPGPVQYALVESATWMMLWLTYEWLVRYRAIGRMLHGPRQIPSSGRLGALAWTSRTQEP